MVKKKAKWKEFYGCSRYPECDWKSWKSPMVTTGSAGDGDDDAGGDKVDSII